MEGNKIRAFLRFFNYTGGKGTGRGTLGEKGRGPMIVAVTIKEKSNATASGVGRGSLIQLGGAEGEVNSWNEDAADRWIQEDKNPWTTMSQSPRP